MNVSLNKCPKNFCKVPNKNMDKVILEYILKIPKLKNDLITGDDSFNISDKEYSNIMQDIQNQKNAFEHNIVNPKELEIKLNVLNFKKNELKIERIIHVRNQEKKSGNKTLLYDQKLCTLIQYQNKLLNAQKNNNN